MLIQILFLLSMNVIIHAQESIASAIDQNQSSIHDSQPLNPKVAIFFFDNQTNLKKCMFDLMHAAKNPAIKGIAFIIDHGGGRPSSFSPLHDMICAIKKDKPVVGFIMGDAFSMGYHVASATTYLVATSLSEVGSIGVCFTNRRYRNIKIRDKEGSRETEADMKVQIFSAGRYKLLGNTHAPDLSEDEKAFIQKEVETLYMHVKAAIANNRNLDLSLLEQWADGKNFFAPEALELSLIDEIGTLLDVERKLLELIQLKNPKLNLSDSIEPVFMNEPDKEA